MSKSFQGTNNSNRKRILFIAEAVTLAHVVRSIALAETIDTCRYNIYFAFDPRYNHIIGKLPFAYKPINSITSKHFLTCVVKGQTGYDVTTLRAYIKDDLKLFREIHPDIIVGDFRLSLMISSRIAGKPYMGICNAYWSPYVKHHFLPVPEHPFTRIFGVWLTRQIFNLAKPLIFKRLALPWIKILREYDMPSNGLDLRKVFTQGDKTLYADLPQLIPTSKLPPSHHFIGPILWSAPVSPLKWWDKLSEEKPIVYVTLGSSGDYSLLPEIFSAMKELPITAIVATAGGNNPTDVPNNIFTADYLPGEEAAKRAKLVICNGGSPTTYQALAAGVPVLGIPSNLDQYLNMLYLQRAGLGLLVRSGKATKQILYQTISEMLNNPSYRNSAESYRQYMKLFSPQDIFPRLVESALEDGVPQSLTHY
ncbi:MAG: glycosyltransferase [Desulfobacterales bacterium]|nr:glycosyltransferase [Desulfobacterales bacterium]